MKIGKRSTLAAGLPGVFQAIRHMRKHMELKSAIRTSLKLNQKQGIDCPGCAWPDPDDERSSFAEYCENGIKAVAEEATKRLLMPTFFKDKTCTELRSWSDFQLGKSGRIAHPLSYNQSLDTYESISWDDAFSLIASNLNQLESPNEAIFYTSGRTSNEAAYLYQLFVRAFGTNNLPDCSNMCHEASGKALNETLGIGKGSVTLQDIHEAELIIVMGQNPGTNHPRMLSALEQCKDNGGAIVAINPLPEVGLMQFANPQKPLRTLSGGIPISDLFVQVRINGDLPLLKAVLYKLLKKSHAEPDIIDQSFVDKYTEGFDQLKDHLHEIDLTSCIEQSGVEELVIDQLVQLLSTKRKVIICWAMGITQHLNGVQTIREIVNLLLLKGSIGKAGAGTCPVRGHSNVQGDRTVGIWESPPPELLDRLEQRFGFAAPRAHGYSVVDAIQAMDQYKASVFMSMGGNFLSASPDTEFTASALSNMTLNVHVATKLNRSHLYPGQSCLILPPLGRTEIDEQAHGTQFVSVENSMGVVHSSQGILPPCSPDLLSEPQIIAQVAQYTLGESHAVEWEKMGSNYDLIRDAIEATIPGFDDYNRRVRQPAGFYLPNGPRERSFPTTSGKAKFTVNELASSSVNTEQFTLMTIRSHDQYNTTIYGLDDRYRGIRNGRLVVFMNEQDMRELVVKPYDFVTISSDYERRRSMPNVQVVPFDIPPKCVATYFPEANPLIPIHHFDPISKTPGSKCISVQIEKA